MIGGQGCGRSRCPDSDFIDHEIRALRWLVEVADWLRIAHCTCGGKSWHADTCRLLKARIAFDFVRRLIR